MNIQLESRYIETNGIRLHAVTAGPKDGELVILLHGFPEFWYGWRYQIGPLADAGFQVLVPDQRGYNQSDKPRGTAAYQLEDTTRDILGLIEASGHRRAHLIGHDWGGIVAWRLAQGFPESVESLAILNAPHPAAFVRSLFRDPTQILRSLYALFYQIPWLPEAVCRNRDWELVVESLKNTSLSGAFNEEDFDRYRQAWYRRGAFTAMLNWYRANLQEPPKIRGSQRIRVPALVIWGARDQALSRGMAGDSVDLCDNGRLILLEYATHWLQHEEAPRVNQLLLEFLQA